MEYRTGEQMKIFCPKARINEKEEEEKLQNIGQYDIFCLPC